MNYLCVVCYGGHVNPERAKVLTKNGQPITCIECGDQLAKERAKSYCIAPMHKSNYVLITNRDDLKGLNNKGGLVK